MFRDQLWDELDRAVAGGEQLVLSSLQSIVPGLQLLGGVASAKASALRADCSASWFSCSASLATATAAGALTLSRRSEDPMETVRVDPCRR